jgi:hypothetical protein
MGTKLEEAFDMRPIKEAEANAEGEEIEEFEDHDPDEDKEAAKNAVTPKEAMEHAAEIVTALSAAEKVDHALTTVAGLNTHDDEMDEIAKEALESYMELKELGMNMADSHSGRIMEVAATMLKTALEARDAKVNRKLKTIDLQLKKMKMDGSGNDDARGPDDGMPFDRNALLKQLKEIRTDEDPEE